jgi:hypothetical protein
MSLLSPGQARDKGRTELDRGGVWVGHPRGRRGGTVTVTVTAACGSEQGWCRPQLSPAFTACQLRGLGHGS